MAMTPDAALVALGRQCGGEALNAVTLLRDWAEQKPSMIYPNQRETATTLARWILDGALDAK